MTQEQFENFINAMMGGEHEEEDEFENAINEGKFEDIEESDEE